MESLGGLPTPSLRWEAGSTRSPLGQPHNSNPDLHRLGPHRTDQREARRGPARC